MGNGTVLWTNPSPTSTFATQTITLSQSYKNFTFIEVEYKTVYNDSSDKRSSNIFKVSDVQNYNKTNAYNFTGSLTAIGLANTNVARAFYPASDTSFTFTNAWTSSATGPDSCIPTKIVGHK